MNALNVYTLFYNQQCHLKVLSVKKVHIHSEPVGREVRKAAVQTVRFFVLSKFSLKKVVSASEKLRWSIIA